MNVHTFVTLKLISIPTGMNSKLLLVISVITIMFFPKVNFGQAPDLGAASGFALFTAAGAFGNTGGGTNISGDIGSNSASVTGFPPGTDIGTIHATDATTAQAAIDVAAAYGYLSTLGGAVLGVTLGSGQTLTPGVYNTGAAATLNGNLTLDGLGDPNALFIIRIGGAFATGTFSNIILINSASFCNVYWQVGGEFDLGDHSIFGGTLIVGGAINLLEGSSLHGRALSTAGAISLFDNVVSFLPAASGTITGTTTVCQGQTGVIYSVPLITDATGYTWSLPPGATITAGANTNNITVSFNTTASSGNITVYGTNACGNSATSPDYAIITEPVIQTSAIYHQ